MESLKGKSIPWEEQLSEAEQRIRAKEWHYWMPIVYKQVLITKEEYDNAPPQFIVDLTAAMKIKAEIEYKKAKEAIEAAQGQ